MFGFYHFAAVKNKLVLGNPIENVKDITHLYLQATKAGAQVVLFPELALSGATCRNFFEFSSLNDDVLQAIEQLQNATKKVKSYLIVGAPLRVNGHLYNCAVIMAQGEIMGIVPKTYITPSESHFFARGDQANSAFFQLKNDDIPFANDLIFSTPDKNFSFAVEIGEDAFAPISPSTLASLQGASTIFHLSAQHYCVDTAHVQKTALQALAMRLKVAYISSNAGDHESTSDFICAGQAFMFEENDLVSERKPFEDSNILYGYIDTEKVAFSRLKRQSPHIDVESSLPINMPDLPLIKHLNVKLKQSPFVVDCADIFKTQVMSLKRTIENIHAKSIVIGVSGGLDSTLALLVAHATGTQVIAVTMPGLGSSSRTKNNALTLCEELKIECKTIDISKAIKDHFKDIGHDGKTHDLTFENAQARERTQILMDLANQNHGFVLGTGDLSELALGWCTYNGDHMSMYGINAALPKTVIAKIVQYYADNIASKTLSLCLIDILKTPISPELLPHKNHVIQQCTEDIVGPYMLHDFFIYHTLNSGASKAKLLTLAKLTFSDLYSEACIEKTIDTFCARFFSQQFKRSCAPDSAKIYSLSLGRFDYRLF